MKMLEQKGLLPVLPVSACEFGAGVGTQLFVSNPDLNVLNLH